MGHNGHNGVVGSKIGKCGFGRFPTMFPLDRFWCGFGRFPTDYSYLPDRDRAGFIRTGGSKPPVVF